MANDVESKFSVYTLTASSPQIFGEVTVIASVYVDGTRFHSDSFILIERPAREVTTIAFQWSRFGAPQTSPQIDTEFMLIAARNAATRHLNDLLYKHASAATKNNLLLTPAYRLVETGPEGLTHLWIEGMWKNELMKIAENCKARALREHFSPLYHCRNITYTTPSRSNLSTNRRVAARATRRKSYAP